MGFTTPLKEKKILGFTVVNYTAKAVFNVFFLMLQFAGFFVFIVSNLLNFSLPFELFLWAILTAGFFISAMRYRDILVRQEIEEGLHDPVWGPHILRQRQRERDELYESNCLTRPFFKFACLLGIHKKE
ncbi:hypothetical protein [Erwinia mallotivora]|uniref:hypothetical protein n=1 Tax=Erwinia mallotivora TaxID=69222 RepID=UPI0021BFD152|nr:hypothetical protein [Erwinia mallotivora]